MAEETVLGGNEEQSIFVNLQKFSFDDLVLIAIPTTQTVIVTRMGRKKTFMSYGDILIKAHSR